MIEATITVRLTGDRGGTYPVTPRVQMEFENHFNVSMIAAFSDNPRITHIYWLGWASMKRAGDPVKLFEEWVDELESIDFNVGGGSPLDGVPSSTPSPS